MPEVLPKTVIEAADAAIINAQLVRKFHARRTKKASKQRTEDIELALTRLHECMKPLRTEIGRFPYGPQTDEAEANRDTIRDVSAAIQRERRKLWKMKEAKREY
jgi:hypothetical protein